MPTGYTATLHDGKEQTFPEFVMSCARAFSALITMRDDPMDAEIPDEFEPNDYSAKQLDLARARLAQVEGWTFREVEQEAKADYESSLAGWRKRREEAAAMQARYEAMIRQVNAWEPPTEDHEGLHKFMLDQLRQSIEVDCLWALEQAAPEPWTAELYRAREIEKAQRDIAYHEKSQAEEIERARKRTAWVRDLRASLAPVSS